MNKKEALLYTMGLLIVISLFSVVVKFIGTESVSIASVIAVAIYWFLSDERNNEEKTKSRQKKNKKENEKK